MSEYNGPKVFPTVDIAAIDLDKNTVLICRKSSELLYRFPGGFSDVKSDSYESDALRELKEETTLQGEALEYIGSTIINDPRYRESINKIKTMFYAVIKWTGEAKASDDLNGGNIKWISLEVLSPSMLVEEHRILLPMLKKWIRKVNYFQSKKV